MICIDTTSPLFIISTIVSVYLIGFVFAANIAHLKYNTSRDSYTMPDFYVLSALGWPIFLLVILAIGIFKCVFWLVTSPSRMILCKKRSL